MNKLEEDRQQFVLRLVIEIKLILTELESGLLILNRGNQLDSVEIDALSGVRLERPLQRSQHLLGEVVADVLCQPN